MTFWSRRSVKAGAKVHRCDNCRQPIEKGQPSTVVSGVHDGDFHSYRVHPECDDLWKEIYREIDPGYDGLPVDTLEALDIGVNDMPTLRAYAKRHPIAAERLMVTVRKWIAEDA